MIFTVETTPARQQKVARSLEFTGSIDPWRVIELSSQVSGQVVEIPIEEGQALAAEAVVCRLDPEAVKIEMTRCQANMEATQAELNRLETGYEPEEIEEAERRLEASQARLAKARDDWQRQTPLVTEGVLSATIGTQIKTRLDEAQAAVRSDEATLRRLQSGYRQELIDRGRADLKVKGADLADATRRMNRHTITTPLKAVATERLKEPGEWVQVGDAVARLVVLDPLKLNIEVPQNYLGKIKVGQQAQLTIDGMPGQRFRAEVSQIVPRAMATTRNFPIQLKLENSDGSLSSGLFSRVRLNIGEPVDSILVPRQAVLIRGETLVVLVADPIPAPPAGGDEGENSPTAHRGGTPEEASEPAPPQPTHIIREVTVHTGLEFGDTVVIDIVEGQPITEGDPIVTLGGTRLTTGMPVMILRTNTTPEPDTETKAKKGESNQ